MAGAIDLWGWDSEVIMEHKEEGKLRTAGLNRTVERERGCMESDGNRERLERTESI